MLLALHTAGHDTGVAIFDGSKLVLAMETERISRVKHDSNASVVIEWLKNNHEDLWEQIDVVCFSTPANYKICQIENHTTVLNSLNKSNLYTESYTNITGRRLPCVVITHELSHAMVAFNQSQRNNELCLINEGRGNFSRNCLIRKKNNVYSLIDADGLAWNASGAGWTALSMLMLDVNKSPSAAGKAMGLAAYGNPKTEYCDFISELVNAYPTPDANLLNEIKFQVNQKFQHFTIHKKADFISSFQYAFTKSVLNYIDKYYNPLNESLSLSGGCALNLPTNSALKLKYGSLLTIPPICNDSGQAIGAGCFGVECFYSKTAERISAYSCGYSNGRNLNINALKNEFDVHDFDPAFIAKKLSEGHIFGLYQGAAEIGPRALGNRSILACSDRPGMKDRINTLVKSRDWYRPLGGVIMEKSLPIVTDDQFLSPHMLYSYNVKNGIRNEATHVDATSRLQTVNVQDNSKLFSILENYESQSGNPVIINTSLNGPSKPIAQEYEHALSDFEGKDIDGFIIEDTILLRR